MANIGPKEQKLTSRRRSRKSSGRSVTVSAFSKRTVRNESLDVKHPFKASMKSTRASSSTQPNADTATDQTVIFIGEADYRTMEEAEKRPISDMPGLARLMSEKSVLE